MRLWHDDIRRPPDDSWTWARTNQEAMSFLEAGGVSECSLDHDLGLERADPDVPDADLQHGWDPVNDGLGLVRWMIEHDLVPGLVTIHSWNPVGARRMADALGDAGRACTVRPYLAAG